MKTRILCNLTLALSLSVIFPGVLFSQTNTITVTRPDGTKSTTHIRELSTNEIEAYEKEKAFDESKKRKEEKDAQYVECLRAAEENYNAAWVRDCRGNGLPDDCTLPVPIARRQDERYESAKAECRVQFLPKGK